MKKLIVLLLSLQLGLVSFVPSRVFAQEASDDLIKSTQTDMLIVAGGGAAGAVLGLSTLSFVEKPSRHVSNIWTGAALGVIAGVVFVAYQSAQKGSEELTDEEASLEFNSKERFAWHQQNIQEGVMAPGDFETHLIHLSF
jgi:hypothetical protein